MARAEETGKYSIYRMGQRVMVLRMMGQRQMKPSWENGLVWLHGGSRRQIGQGSVQAPPLPDENRAEGGEGQSGLRRVE